MTPHSCNDLRKCGIDVVEGPANRRDTVLVRYACCVTFAVSATLVSAQASQPACRQHRSCVTRTTASSLRTESSPLLDAERAARDAVAAYHMKRALSAAETCRDIAQSLHWSLQARKCNETMQMAASSLGNARALSGTVYWEQRFGSATAVRSLATSFAHTDWRRLARAVPPVAVAFDGGNATLEYLHDIDIGAETHVDARAAAGSVSRARSLPMVAARINGHAVTAGIDTGASFPLVLDRSHARSLGAVPLVSGILVPPTLGDSGPGAMGDYDLVKKLRFGTLVMHDVAAVVVSSIPGSEGVLVGLPMLANYAQVTFGKSRVRLETDTSPCPAPVPLSARSTNGAPSDALHFPVRADGKVVSAVFDTGSTLLLLGGPALLQHPIGPNGGMGYAAGYWPHRALDVWVGNFHMRSANAPVGAVNVSADIDIGSPVLTLADVRLDFQHHSICFLHR